ncbi:hypothetical protein, partial [Streptomyces radiopugnans]|uniref:hypothetical protein n=1 Tax=Streptomyces radiopugnans TaxID=403935 RepID=UPI003F19D6FA
MGDRTPGADHTGLTPYGTGVRSRPRRGDGSGHRTAPRAGHGQEVSLRGTTTTSGITLPSGTDSA